VKIFPQKFFALKVGLGREELQGISVDKKKVSPEGKISPITTRA
jgi:hypothetical protein